MRVISSTWLRYASDQRFYPPEATGEKPGRISRRHGPCASDSIPIRTPLGCSGSWVLAGRRCSGQGAVAGGAGAGPAVQQVLDGVEDLVEGESGV